MLGASSQNFRLSRRDKTTQLWHGTIGERNYGGFGLVWISYLRFDLNAGALVFRRAKLGDFFQPASSRRPSPGETAAHLSARQQSPGSERNRQGLRVPQERIRRGRARRDQEDRA